MHYDPSLHHRRSIRLRGFDYASAGAYFLTICTRDRQCVFGSITGGKVKLSQRGLIAKRRWESAPDHFTSVALDHFVVMPNHVHAIIWMAKRATHASPLRTPANLASGPAPASLGAIVGSYKSAVSREINKLRPDAARGLWQPNYFEHVIRTNDALHAIRHYIAMNPRRWHHDIDNPTSDASDNPLNFVASVRNEADDSRLRRDRDAGVAATARAVAHNHET